MLFRSNSSKKVIVVGAGIAGLAASIRLAKSGFRVSVLEANEDAGGNLREIRNGEFRFDTGPSILTKPEYIKDLFLLWDKNPDDYIRFIPVEPLFRNFFSDGSFIDSFSDRKKFERELSRKSDEPFKQVDKLLDESAEIFRLTHEVFLERSLHIAKNYLNWPSLRGIFRFNRIRAFQSMHQYNQRTFRDKRLVQLFNRYASYNGSNPFEAPATLNVITHFAVNSGSFLPEGGMFSITKALKKLATEAGVEFRFNSRVTAISHEHGKVKGVECKEEFFPADVVVKIGRAHV